MQYHTLKRRTPNKRKVQVGRGGTRGKTSGKGTKGQNARSGRKKRPEMRDIIKRLPKLRGRGISPLKSIQGASVAVNLVEIEKAFKAGETVSPKTLTDKNIVALARIMKKYWLQKEIDDITQMNLRIQDHDFKNFSEAQNMQQKRERFILEREAISQMLVDYAIQTNDWLLYI